MAAKREQNHRDSLVDLCKSIRQILRETHPSAAFDLTLPISWRPLRSGQRSAVPLITCQDPENHSSRDRNVGSEVRDDAGGAVRDKHYQTLPSVVRIVFKSHLKLVPMSKLSRSQVMVNSCTVIGNPNKGFLNIVVETLLRHTLCR